MKVTIVGRKCTPRNSFKERAEQKLSKLEKFFVDESSAKILAKVEKNKKIVEITVKCKDLIFRAESSSPDLEQSLDECVDTLIRQIRKNKTKVEKKLRLNGLEDFMVVNSEFEETDYEIIRKKSIELKPQSVDEAILQMNILNHQFYMFLNSETNIINVVYHRNDGGYGLIQPNS